MPTPTSPLLGTSGRQLLLALYTVARRLKARTEVRGLDAASVFVLHNVHANQPLRVSELAAAVGMAPQAVSNQLQRMADRGIVTARREGSSIIYRVADPCVTALLELGLCLAEDAQEVSLIVSSEVVNFYPTIAARFSRWIYEQTQLRIHVIVTNHGPAPREAVLRPRLTDGWHAEPAQATVEVAAGGATASVPFTIHVPSTARPGRHVPTVDLTLGGEPRGELAELLLEVLPA